MKPPITGLVVALVLATIAGAQNGVVTPSSIPVHDLTISSLTFNALQTLAQKYHVVIGTYGAFIGSDNHINISIKDGTLDDAFDAIVKADPRYEWKQTKSGAIHFIFRDSPLSLLDVTVHSFDDDNPARVQTGERLAKLPEVAGWLEAHRCLMGEMITDHGPKWGKFVVHAKDVPLSAVLDEIYAKSGTYIWSVIQYSADPCRIYMTP
jgi:hypothetical protein